MKRSGTKIAGDRIIYDRTTYDRILEAEMRRDFDEILQVFNDLTERIQQVGEAVNLMFWDLRTGAPIKGVEHRSKVIGTLSTDIFRLSTGDEMRDCLEILENEENFNKLDSIRKSLVQESRKEFNRYTKIPEEMYKEYVILTSQSESAWEVAKREDDFQGFKGYLEKIVDFNKKFIEIWGFEGHPYNALLEYFEPGMTVAELDAIFSVVRERTIKLLKRIKESGKEIDDTFFFSAYFEEKKQEKLSLKMLEAIDFSLEAGRLDRSEHPFTSGIASPNDVRLTTKYHTDNLSSALLSTLHEGGHGLYEQNVDSKLEGTILATGTSSGIHESQSRFFENVIGRSEGFWKAYYNEVEAIFPEELSGISSDDFFKGLNKATPSLIRTEADELTYNLHIMVRYEIEKGLFDGTYNVADLPEIWKDKMKKYLGIEPMDDKTGVLQDVHWAGGLFGYFPSYALGNMYAAQFRNALRKDIPDFEEKIARREIAEIKEWLVERVHRHGKLMSPGEIIRNATGEAINSKYLMDYLEEKLVHVYDLK